MSESISCNATIQQGPRKGLRCLANKLENEYCCKHQRNKEYDLHIADGNIPCSMFFRGCNIILTNEQITAHDRTCNDCRIKKNPKKFSCNHDGCPNKIITEEHKYCKLHERDLLRDAEKERNIKYCNIERGCFNIVGEGLSKCTECITQTRTSIANDIQILRAMHNINVQPTTDTLSIKQEDKLIEIHELWRGLQRNAYSRELMITITRDDFELMAIRPCYYCGFASNVRLNGIDRIDNNKGYISSNCIPCCKMCNIMKQAQHPIEFLDKAGAILNYVKNSIPISQQLVTKWRTTYITPNINYLYVEYKSKATNTREILFELSEDEFYTLRKLPCYLCGILASTENVNGIDRYNPAFGYTITNCRPCCTHCNIIKGQYSFIDIHAKCAQIVEHNCNKDIFDIVPTRAKRTELRNEFYTATAIIDFMDTNNIDNYIEWCKDKEKSDIYLSELNDIHLKYISNSVSKATAINSLQHALEKERTSKTNISQNKKHHASTIYSMITVSGVDKFKEWYKSQYTPSSSFDKILTILLSNVDGATKEVGTEFCRKFMEAEKNRRNNQKLRDKSRKEYVAVNLEEEADAASSPPAVSSPPAAVTATTFIVPLDNTVHAQLTNKYQSPKQKNKKLLPTDVQPSQPTPPAIPKQWKVLQIYNAIVADNCAPYKQWCETTNELSGAEWETSFAQLLTDIRATNDIATAEPIIRAFIEELRRQRHLKLSAKVNERARPLDREDRIQWPATSVLKAYKEGKLAAFREWLTKQDNDQDNDQDDPAASKRWEQLSKQLESDIADADKTAIISKFMTARRARKARAAT